MARRKKPRFDDASMALGALASTPRVKAKTALELFVEKDFENLLKALTIQNYSLSEVSTTLSRYGISCTPKLLRAALYDYALQSNRVSEIPSSLIPEAIASGNLDHSHSPVSDGLQNETIQSQETGFEELIDQRSQASNGEALSSARTSRFNDVDLKFN